MTIVDTQSLEEIAEQLLEAAGVIRENADADADALQIDLDDSEANDEITDQTSSDAGAAAGGAIDEDDYKIMFSSLGTTPSSKKTLFERIFDDIKEAFLTEVSQDTNIALRGAINKSIVAADEFDALVGLIASESDKIVVAGAAGLIFPPSKADVKDMRDQTQAVSDEIDNTVNDLRSAEARRRAARSRRGDDQRIPREEPQATIIGDVDGREVEPMSGPTGTSGVAEPQPVDLNLAASGAGSIDSDAQSQRRGVASANLSASTQALNGTVLDKVSYITICLAIAQMGVSKNTEGKALRALGKLIFLVDRVKFILSSQFSNDLQQSMQELAADSVAGIGVATRKKLVNFDTWLALTVPPLPTFVSTVDALGDRTPDIIFFQDLAGRCALQFQSFCDFQGLLEIAKALDAELGLVLPRSPRSGKACLLVEAPDADQNEVEKLVDRPDSQSNLLLAKNVSVNDDEIQAYFPRADVTRNITTPIPQLSGVLDDLVLAGADFISVSGVAGANNVATISNSALVLEPATPQEETLRYSTFELDAGVYTFELIDKPVIGHAASETVRLDGEYRNVFDGVYEQRSEIGGGPGALNIGADGETRETLNYDSSTFDPETGVHTFALSATAQNPHQLNIIARPLSNEKRLLFKPTLVNPASRFNVNGDTVTHATDAFFDFSSEIDPVDFSGGGPFRLVVGNPESPIGVEVASVTLGSLTLTEPFHDEPITGAPLSRLDRLNAAGSTFKARLRTRQVDDLRLNAAVAGDPIITPVAAQVILDAGSGTRHITRLDGTITDIGSGVQRIASAAKAFRVGDVGSDLQVQGGQRYLNTVIDAVVDDKTLEFTGSPITGTMEISATNQGSPPGTEVYGTGTSFKTEVKQNDWVNFGGTNTFKVRAVVDDLTLVLATDETAAAGTGLTGYRVAGPDAMSGRSVSITRSPQETLNITGATLDADGDLWNFQLSSASLFEHGTQELDAPPSIQIIPQSLTLFPTTPTSTEPRFDPGILPPGSTTLRATFEDPAHAPILGPLISLGGGQMTITGFGNIAYDSALQDDPPLSFQTLTFELSKPLSRPLSAGTVIKVDTTTVASQVSSFFPVEWELPFQIFMAQILDLLEMLEQKLCRMLEGRPVDVALTASAISASAKLIKPQIILLKIVLQGLLAGLPESKRIQSLLTKLTAAGMDRAIESVASGDIATLAAMTFGESTFQGELLARTVAYRDGLTVTSKAVKADSMAAQLKGDEMNTRVLAETRLGFKEAAAEDIARRRQAATNLEADAQEITS